MREKIFRVFRGKRDHNVVCLPSFFSFFSTNFRFAGAVWPVAWWRGIDVPTRGSKLRKSPLLSPRRTISPLGL